MASHRRTTLFEVMVAQLLMWQLSALNIPLDYKLLEEFKQPPAITAQSPKNYIVDPRDNIEIKCEAKGNPPPSFHWTKDGVDFHPEADERVQMRGDSGTLVVDVVGGGRAERYEGEYQCRASNSGGTALSDRITVQLSRSPLWPKEVIDPVQVKEGSSAVLPCNPPPGIPLPVIFWMDHVLQRLSQDERVSQGLNGDLYFSNVRASDARDDYICYARFVYTQTIQQKQPIKLTVQPVDASNDTESANASDADINGGSRVDLYPPRFLSPVGASSTKMVLKGDVLSLECIAAGLPTPRIQWFKSGAEMPWERAKLLNFNKTLILANVTEGDDGNYVCLASNRLGVQRHTTTVAIEAAPYWLTGGPESRVVQPGEQTTIMCRATGNPKPSIRWLLNGGPIEEAGNDPNRKVDGDTIILSNLPEGTSAVYQCEATNKHGSILGNAFVNVLAVPPRILSPMNKVYSAVVNQTVHIECKVFASPQPTFMWFKDAHGGKLEGPRYQDSAASDTLVVPRVQKGDAGVYTCHVQNYLNKNQSLARLLIKDPTRIVQPPSELRAQRFGVATFECHATHDPSLSLNISWFHDGYPLPESPRHELEGSGLTIVNVTEEDVGHYKCRASTELDHAEAEARLTVIDSPDATLFSPELNATLVSSPSIPSPVGGVAVTIDRPDSPMDLELTNRQDLSVRLTWNPGSENNDPIKEFVVEYEEDWFEPGVWHRLSSFPGSRNSVLLDSLSPYVSYRFRVVAVNSVGPSEPSLPTERCLTVSASPQINPSGVKGEGTNPTNMIISWTPMRGVDQNGPGFGYRVSWRLQSSGDAEWTTETVLNRSHVVVSGTPTFSPYEIRVRAVNNIGLGPEPDVVIGYSGEDVPLESPKNVRVEVLNSTIIKVTWEPVPLESVRGHILGYRVHYWRVRALGDRRRRRSNREVLEFQPVRTHGVVPGLRPYSLYQLEVCVFNRKSDGPASTRQQFHTPEGVPSQPENLRLYRPSQTSLKIDWDHPELINGRLTGYSIQYQTINHTYELGPLKSVDIPTANASSWTLRDLPPNGRYKVYVRARTRAGLGAAAFEEATTVMERAQIVSVAGEEFANVSWMPAAFRAGTVFYIEYMLNNSVEGWEKSLRTPSVNTSQSYIVVQGLEAGTAYKMRLASALQASVSFSEAVVFEARAEPSQQVNIPTQGWFIGLMCAIVLLVLIILIICFVRRNRGGKYPVKEKEDAHPDPEAQPMKEDTYRSLGSEDEKVPDGGGGKGGRPSPNGSIRRGGSADSLVEYGDGGEGQFNEDGSFIGQYTDRKDRAEPGPDGEESSTTTSPVNPLNPLNGPTAAAPATPNNHLA
ncbi:neuronal cell adhesion molecule isoform X2 [Petromyzon marinus]|uniref:Neuronal cell adhesion molecule isoform X2 n=1 Tax=Petromyzon marinus TaxID=7757 RepID=A0AAJ7T2E7_PETMA|nr:neuronal cell adhesion molecule isoform X2 [Petromyzon marinus]